MVGAATAVTRRIRELPPAPAGVSLPAGAHRYGTPALFGAYASGGRYVLAPHVRYLSAVITAALRRGDARIIVELPPRFGKSTFCSGYLPPWFLGMNPDKRVGLITYEADYAHTWGRRGRDLLDAHGHIFPGGPVRPSPASRAAGRWDIDGHAGGLVATGIGGAITGRGFDLLVIDDYVKNQAEAMSSLIRERTWEYWLATLSTRIEPGGAVVILATRWHEDDLIGRLRAQQARALADGEEHTEPWTVITMRAVCEDGDEDPLGRAPGEPLWGSRWSADRLARVRKRVGEFWWAALYQQRPAPAEGGHFKRSWIERYVRRGDAFILGDRPVYRSGMVVFQTVDVAASTKTSADYTVVATWGWIPTTGDLLLLDVWRDRIELPRQPDLIREQAAKWNPAQIGVESNTYGMGLIQSLAGSGLPIVPLRADADKLARALPAAAMYAARKVWHPHAHEALWVTPYEDEIASFPNGKNDDQVDAAGYAALACRRIGQYRPGVDVTGGDDVVHSEVGYGMADNY